MSDIKKEILEAFNFRYACKKFDTSKKISKEDFELILYAARLSPSSFGFEPWKILVIQNENIREKLRKVSWGGEWQIPTASHLAVILTRLPIDLHYDSKYVQDFMRNVQKLPENVIKMESEFIKTFQDKDFDLTDDRKLFDWASKQAYIVLGNMMTVAALLKIDSCAMEGFNRKKFEEILVEEHLLNPAHFEVSVMVAFGYRDKSVEIHSKTRAPEAEKIQWV